MGRLERDFRAPGVLGGKIGDSELSGEREGMERALRHLMKSYNVRTQHSYWLEPGWGCKMLDRQDTLTLLTTDTSWVDVGPPIVISKGYYGVLYSFGFRALLDIDANTVEFRLLKNGNVYPGYDGMLAEPRFATMNQQHRVYGMNLSQDESFVLQVRRVGSPTEIAFVVPSYYAWEWAGTRQQDLDFIA